MMMQPSMAVSIASLRPRDGSGFGGFFKSETRRHSPIAKVAMPANSATRTPPIAESCSARAAASAAMAARLEMKAVTPSGGGSMRSSSI
jgi:hypothetical protein